MGDQHKQYLLRISWPSSALSSNSRTHWRPKATATKAYRSEAWATAKLHSITAMPDAVLEFTFCPPDRRRRDIHNMPAAMKAVIDGIADAMGCDDVGFRCRFPDHFGEVVRGGCVLVHVKPVDAGIVAVIGGVS